MQVLASDPGPFGRKELRLNSMHIHLIKPAVLAPKQKNVLTVIPYSKLTACMYSYNLGIPELIL